MKQSRHHLLMLFLVGIVFEMDQETSGTVPACILVRVSAVPGKSGKSWKFQGNPFRHKNVREI